MRNNTGDKQSTSAGAEKMSESRRERERKWNEGLRHSFTSPQCPLLAAHKTWVLSNPHVTQVGSLHFSQSEDDNKDLGCTSLCTVSTGVLWSVLKQTDNKNKLFMIHIRKHWYCYIVDIEYIASKCPFYFKRWQVKGSATSSQRACNMIHNILRGLCAFTEPSSKDSTSPAGCLLPTVTAKQRWNQMK